MLFHSWCFSGLEQLFPDDLFVRVCGYDFFDHVMSMKGIRTMGKRERESLFLFSSSRINFSCNICTNDMHSRYLSSGERIVYKRWTCPCNCLDEAIVSVMIDLLSNYFELKESNAILL